MNKSIYALMENTQLAISHHAGVDKLVRLLRDVITEKNKIHSEASSNDKFLNLGNLIILENMIIRCMERKNGDDISLYLKEHDYAIECLTLIGKGDTINWHAVKPHIVFATSEIKKLLEFKLVENFENNFKLTTRGRMALSTINPLWNK